MNGISTSTEAADWKRVACILGNDRITEIHISNLLVTHGIQPAIHGSRAYAVEVPSSRAAEAVQLLRSDARNLEYHISFGGDEVLEAPEPKEVVREISVSSLLKRADYSSETALGRFLRSGRISKLAMKYPYMFSLCAHERQYLVTPHTRSTGWDVTYELHNSPGKRSAGCRGWCQLLNGGKEIHFFGAGEWQYENNGQNTNS